MNIKQLNRLISAIEIALQRTVIWVIASMILGIMIYTHFIK